MRFQVLTEASTKMAVFWVVVPCSLVEVSNVSKVLAASIIRATYVIRSNNVDEWVDNLLGKKLGSLVAHYYNIGYVL
jgi:hypothetical protein